MYGFRLVLSLEHVITKLKELYETWTLIPEIGLEILLSLFSPKKLIILFRIIVSINLLTKDVRLVSP